MYPNRSPILRSLPATLLLFVLSLLPLERVTAAPQAEDDAPAAVQVVEAVNALRTKNGLDPLTVHPVLMRVAQIEADGIANGMPGHWRPDGLTLGQWLIVLGYPLAGDLTLDGFRSENWIAAKDANSAINMWLGDVAHTNTMLSPDRSDIGVGVAVGDQVIIVLETALQTSSGQMQAAAYPLLTQIASSNSGAEPGYLVSQYINPVVLSTSRPDGDVFHRIKYGQSLWSIAIAYHTTIDQIRAWNNLARVTTVYEGQILLVQRSATQPPPATLTLPPSSAPLLSATPHISTTRNPATASPTRIVAPSLTNPGENIPSQDFTQGFRVVLIVVVLALGVLLGMLLIQRTN